VFLPFSCLVPLWLPLNPTVADMEVAMEAVMVDTAVEVMVAVMVD